MNKEIQCNRCKKFFHPNRSYKYDHSLRGIKRTFCSTQCSVLFFDKKISITCHVCGKQKTRKLSQISRSKSGYNFCSKSCSVSFNNTQKRNSRRSKVEKALFDLLVAEFPQLHFSPGDKTMLDGYEVDIAIPELNLGIEWNGIVHFKPIYGQTKLTKIQQRDQEKQKIAEVKGISLLVITDLVSTKARVNEAFAQISDIIRSTL